MTSSTQTYDRIDSFLERLAITPAPPNSVNPWSSETVFGQIRLQNLRRYFAQLMERGVDTLMLGEAPGYLGCRRSGIGFTSEPQLLSGIPSLSCSGERGYQRSGEFPELRKEQSATIVWGELARLDFVPLIWASFPFHPHKPGAPNSNRTPKRPEIDFGRPIFLELIEAFQIGRVFAVGNIAHASLAAAGDRLPRSATPPRAARTISSPAWNGSSPIRTISAARKSPRIHPPCTRNHRVAATLRGCPTRRRRTDAPVRDSLVRSMLRGCGSLDNRP
ncbi:MAG: uracil-DNA glycosylase [Thermomicrobiales bacterium]